MDENCRQNTNGAKEGMKTADKTLMVQKKGRKLQIVFSSFMVHKKLFGNKKKRVVGLP